ncbi:MAG: Na(+) H(+) antiporter subunit A, partial [uncultured Rubrobacteraceae bacterium]
AAAACAGPDGGAGRGALWGGEAGGRGAGRGGVRGARLRGDAVGLALRRGCRGRGVGAELGPAAAPGARWARGALRAAGDRCRVRRARLLLALPAAAPGARGPAGLRRHELLLLYPPVHGLDGRARYGAGPRIDLRLLGPDGHRLLLPDRLRPSRRGLPGLGPDGPARHRDNGGAAPDRGAPALRCPRDVLRPGTGGPGRTRAAAEHRGRAHRGRRARQERPGAPALLAAARDGRPHAGLGVPALGGDGGRGGSPDRSGLPPPPEERVPAGRPPRRRHPLDGGRRRAGPDAGRLEATARLLDHCPVRARGDDVRPRRPLRRGRGGVLRDRARHRQERPLPDSRHRHGGDGREPPEPARGVAKAHAAARRGERARGGHPHRAPPDGRLLRRRVLLRRRAREGTALRRHHRGGRGHDARLHLAFLGRPLSRRTRRRAAGSLLAARLAGRGARGHRADRRFPHRAVRGFGRGRRSGLVRGLDAAGRFVPRRGSSRVFDGAWGLRPGRGAHRLAAGLVAGRARREQARQGGGARAAVPDGGARAQRRVRRGAPVGDPEPQGAHLVRAGADGGAGGGQRAGDAHRRGVPGGRVPGRRCPADAGDARGCGGLGHDGVRAAARDAGAGALGLWLRAGGGLRLLRGAQRGARGRARRDDAHAAAHLHPEAHPLPHPAPPGPAALARAGAQGLRLRGRGGVRVRRGLGGAFAAARGVERRRRAHQANPRRPRQERRHGHARGLPRAGHFGRDHGRLPRPSGCGDPDRDEPRQGGDRGPPTRVAGRDAGDSAPALPAHVRHRRGRPRQGLRPDGGRLLRRGDRRPGHRAAVHGLRPRGHQGHTGRSARRGGLVRRAPRHPGRRGGAAPPRGARLDPLPAGGHGAPPHRHHRGDDGGPFRLRDLPPRLRLRGRPGLLLCPVHLPEGGRRPRDAAAGGRSV